MSDANVVKLLQPGSFADPLTEVLRNGARALLAQAIEAEVAEFLAKHVDLKTATGLSRVVRHGHLPEREVMTGIGPVGVRQPRVRDRGAADDAGRIRFTPAILPPYARRSRSLEVLVPILYLKGISTGDFEEPLAALLGKALLGVFKTGLQVNAVGPHIDVVASWSSSARRRRAGRSCSALPTARARARRIGVNCCSI